jgi:hypothetical protein
MSAALTPGLQHACLKLKLPGGLQVRQPLYNRPSLLFSSSATHTASLKDCLMDECLIWLLSSWVPPDQAEVNSVTQLFSDLRLVPAMSIYLQPGALKAQDL